MQEADPTDALAVLGDETRIAILRVLAEADEPLPFSELRRRAEISDPGRFNYHLSKLREYFVREEDGGYALREAGSRVVATAGVAGQISGSSGDGVDSTVNVDEDTGSTVDVDETGVVTSATDEERCPVCGETDCERLFHVHLSVPWQ